MRSASVTRRPYKFIFCATVILLIAFGVRVLDVTARSLWFDEAVEYFSASVPFHMLPRAVISSNYQPPLYTYLLHVWLQISIEPISLRFLPIMLSMLTIAGLMSWAFIIFGTRGAALTGIIAAVMPTEIYYAQDVGEYALLVFTLTWSLFFLYLAHRKSRWRYWILWALFSIASVYSHYGAAIIVVSAAGMTLLENVWRKRKKPVYQQSVLIAASAVLAVPLLVYFVPAQIGRVSGSAHGKPGLSICTEIAKFVESIGDTFTYNLIGWPLSHIPKSVGIIVLGLVGLSAVFVLRYPLRRVFGWLTAAYVAYYVLVRVGFYADVYGLRYGLIFTPLFILALVAVVEGLWRNRSTVLAMTLLCVVVGIEVYALPNPTVSQWIRSEPSWMPSEQMHEAFAFWQDQRREDESTFVYYGAVPTFRYYLRVFGIENEDGDSNPRPNIECSARQATSVCVENKLFFSHWVRALPPEEKIKSMVEIMGGMPKRLWLVFSHVHGDEEENMIQ